MPFKWRQTATTASLVTGTALRIYAYVRQPSMWIDEVAVTRNVLDHSFWELVSRQLDYGQVAPVGYLAVLKILLSLFGASPYVLRFPALISSIAALILFWRVAERVTDGFAAAAATAMVAFSPLVLYQAAQVKQYSSDFALSLLILLVTLALIEGKVSPIAAAIAGAVSVWFSQHAILTAAACGAVLLIRHWRVVAAWGVSSALALAVSIHNTNPATMEYMHHFWASGFLQWPSALAWLWNQLQRVFIQWNTRLWRTGDLIAQVYAGLAIVGSILQSPRPAQRGEGGAKRRVRGVVALHLCIVVVLLVSAFQWYPFPPLLGLRLIFFECSLLILMAAAAVEWLTRRVAPLALILFAAPTVVALIQSPPPYKHDMTAEMLKEIRARWQPGDVLYANGGIALGVLYYAPKLGFQAEDIVAGQCSADPRSALRELDRLRGRRVWVVVNNGRDQRTLLDFYLRHLGTRVESIAIDGPGTWESALFRPVRPIAHPLCAAYDLRDPLPDVNAENFEIPPQLRFYDQPWWCFGVFGEGR